MCNDPNAPNPAAFCCMRAWAIVTIVFGVFNILGTVNYLPAFEQRDPCYICPDSHFDYASSSAITHHCQNGWEATGTPLCLDSAYAAAVSSWCSSNTDHTEEKCSESGGTWTEDTCKGYHDHFSSVFQAGSAQCTALQNVDFVKSCCVAGPTPPGNAGMWYYPIGLILTFIVGVLKVVGGSMSSCCCGEPSAGKTKCAVICIVTALLLDILYAHALRPRGIWLLFMRCVHSGSCARAPVLGLLCRILAPVLKLRCSDTFAHAVTMAWLLGSAQLGRFAILTLTVTMITAGIDDSYLAPYIKNFLVLAGFVFLGWGVLNIIIGAIAVCQIQRGGMPHRAHDACTDACRYARAAPSG